MKENRRTYPIRRLPVDEEAKFIHFEKATFEDDLDLFLGRGGRERFGKLSHTERSCTKFSGIECSDTEGSSTMKSRSVRAPAH